MKMSIEEREQWKDNWTYDPKTNKMNSSSLTGILPAIGKGFLGVMYQK